MGVKSIFKFFFRRALELTVIALALVFIPYLPPYCSIQKPYKVAKTLPLEGKLSLNEKVNGAELWHKGDFLGPESFASYDNELYTSLHSGDIVKLTGNSHVTPVVTFGKPCKHGFEEKTCGRPLGLTFDAQGTLYAADAYYGIFKVNVKTGEKTRLVSPDDVIGGKKPKVFNGVAVASSGDVYWTDSSSDFSLEDGVFDMLADGSGRLVHYNPKTKKNKVLIDNLHFANGVVLSKKEDFVLVSETARSKIHRHYLTGPKASKSDVFVDGLPGMPDNLKDDGHGGFLIPLYTSHDPTNPNAVQIFGPFPMLRKLFARILGVAEGTFSLIDQVYANDFAKMGIHYIGHFQSVKMFTKTKRFTLIQMNNNGEIIDSFYANNGKLISISEAFIYKDHLLLGSPHNDFIGRIALSEVGLKKPITVKHVPVTKEKRSVPEESVKPSTTQKPKTAPPTEAPKQTPPPTKKVTPTQAPKQTQPPKPQTPPPTQAPKPQTPPPTQAPKPQTPPPTQAPKPKTAAPTEAPKPKTTPPTQAPKPKTLPPTQAPKPKTAPPTEAPKPKTVPPTVTTPAPKPTQAPNKQQPTQAKKEVPKDAPKDSKPTAEKAKKSATDSSKVNT